MKRMYKASSEYKSENFVEEITLENEFAPQIFRKLKNIATLIDSAVEIEDFQAIGV